jgi:hypothetical protein
VDGARSGNFLESRVDKLKCSFPKGIYVYRKILGRYSVIPKGFYVKASFLHKIPSGLKMTFTLMFYKHKFPSGMEGDGL